jgi:predicted MFS family arabinose efflux permease
MFFMVMYFTACVTQGTLIHQVAHVVDRGFSAEKGALVIGIAGIVGSLSKIIFGYLCDRIGSETAFTIINTFAFLGLVCMAGLRADLSILLYGCGVLFGLGYGAIPAVLAVKAAHLFHGADFGKIYGLLYTALGLGGATGSWAGGKIFDLTGNYSAAIYITFPLLVLVTYLFWHIGSGGRCEV